MLRRTDSCARGRYDWLQELVDTKKVLNHILNRQTWCGAFFYFSPPLKKLLDLRQIIIIIKHSTFWLDATNREAIKYGTWHRLVFAQWLMIKPVNRCLYPKMEVNVFRNNELQTSTQALSHCGRVSYIKSESWDIGLFAKWQKIDDLIEKPGYISPGFSIAQELVSYLRRVIFIVLEKSPEGPMRPKVDTPMPSAPG